MSVQGSYLQTVSNWKQIHDFPLNSSVSKAVWTIPKSKRFEQAVSNQKKVDAFYDVPEKIYKNKRATSFGIGQRLFDLGNTKKAQGPQDYHILSEIDQNLKNKYKQVVFGESRDKCKIVGDVDKKDIKKFPGPGQYEANPSQLKQGKFTMKGKYSPKKKQVQVGPGQYEIKTTFGKDNSLFVSTFHKNASAFIKPPIKDKVQRVSQGKFDSTLPAIQYDYTYQINTNGKFANSKYKNVSQVKISKEIHPHDKQVYKEVGPGYYQAPSDFGIYTSSKFNSKKQ